MAYSDATIAAITDIPPLVKAFATSIGMTNGGSSSVPTFTPVGGGLTFTMTATHGAGSGYSIFDTLKLDGGGATTPAVLVSPGRATSPTIDTTITPVLPTKLMLHGDITPKPWIAITVCYGYNWYRHMYIGVLEGIGGFTGGEVISAMSRLDRGFTSGGAIYYRDRSQCYLFQANQTFIGPTQCGGANIVHASNPVSWRQFYNASQNDNALDGITVFGGFGDGIAEPYIARGQMPAANMALLAPINLFASGVGNLLTPIGRVPGIRMIDMSRIDPETSFAIGADNWRVIPAYSRSPSQYTPWAYKTLQAPDSSWMLGYAFKQ